MGIVLSLPLKSRAELFENFFFVNGHYLRQTNSLLADKTIFKSASLHKGTPLRQFNVVSYKRPEMSLSLENTTTLFPGEGGREESCANGYEIQFRKILSKYASVLSKIVSKDSSCSSEHIRVSLKKVNHFVLWLRATTVCYHTEIVVSEVTLIYC